MLWRWRILGLLLAGAAFRLVWGFPPIANWEVDLGTSESPDQTSFAIGFDSSELEVSTGHHEHMSGAIRSR
jgi:hypothetical protein